MSDLSSLTIEFRTALREEIEAAKRAAAGASVQLLNGRRIGQIGRSHQYHFRLESTLQVPDGSPADLLVAGSPPIEATVISVEGPAITLSVAADLGQFIPRATLQSNVTQLLRKLIERIEVMEGRDNPSGDRLLGRVAPTGNPAPVSLAGELNNEQSGAIASSLGRDATFIWGPPGTGKTKTIGTVGEQLSRQNRSVLVVSHTNTAVDQALLHIADALGDELVDGSVIRVGEPRDHRLAQRPRLLSSTHVNEREQELADRQGSLQAQRDLKAAEVENLQRTIALCEWVAEAQEDLNGMSSALQSLHALERSAEAAREAYVEHSRDGVYWEEAAEQAVAAEQLLKQEQGLIAALARTKDALAAAEQRFTSARELLRTARDLLERSEATNALLRAWRRLPKPEDQRQVVELRVAELAAASDAARSARQAARDTASEMEGVQSRLREFRTRYAAEPGEVREAVREHGRRQFYLEQEARRLETARTQERRSLGRMFGDRLSALREWGLGSDVAAATAEEMLAEIQRIHEDVARQVEGHDVASLRSDRDLLNREIVGIDMEIASISESLRKVEELVVADALVVATTLTRAYLRDSIQARRFDTVILDEASMAPIPALWVVAGLADSVVIVGDFKQLPPIKQSTHDLAEKWLGHDVFEVSRTKEAYKRGNRPDYFKVLRTQYRMHPEISAIVNEFIYDGELRDDEKALDDTELDLWFDRLWGHDAPVLLVDTSSLGAWVTSVPSGGRASRLNFLSAAVAVELSQRLLRRDRPELPQGERPRILIATPYRPQARLLQRMLDDEHPGMEVVAGTAHQFQGNEAGVVIFDFVNDEPHWRVGMFNMANDADTGRLLNVALTRARRRLILIGDFAWMERNTKPQAFLRQLLAFLRARYPVVDARAIMPIGLSARAAAAQANLQGGQDAQDSERLVMTQDHFYRLLMRDLQQATERIVIYSPFMTRERVAHLEPQLRAAVDRGVRVYVITKTQGERRVRERANCGPIERALSSWSITVIHKLHMHEKLVFVDGGILWSGSLNPLSFSDTQEIMERRASKEVAQDFARTLRLDELLGLYDADEARCPVCNSEVIPAEGRDDPFYWRCVEDGCHTRSIDQPAPRDGRIICSNCAGPVCYGAWGGEPYWRCEQNPRHRQRIVRNHLRLPRMRDMVPPAELRVLDRRFHLA